ncbi:MAG TPA: NAD(P)-dependent oxidoreductase [Candidatus Kapabacteria bacterium]|nr:NAD(P)-dependent oxidoreductase [Candidatus Kapabacteria bacterium]
MKKTFLGMGMLGSNWVRAMRKRGEDVNVWNRTASKMKALEEVGAKSFSTPAEAVKSAKRVHICVSDDAAVDNILAQAEPNLEKDVIIIDHTTTSATGAKERTARWKAKGITYIHAPVFMGPANALESTGVMLISGDQNVIKMIEPELSKMTGTLENVGEKVGEAAAYKLLGNHMFMGISAAITDTFTLGKSLGLSVQDVTDFIEQMSSAPMKSRVARLMMKNYDAPTWELLMARKDARLMVEEAERADKELMVMPALGKEMDALIAEGLGSKDWSIVAKEAIS